MVRVDRDDRIGPVEDRDSPKPFLLKPVHIPDDFRQQPVRGLAYLIFNVCDRPRTLTPSAAQENGCWKNPLAKIASEEERIIWCS